MRSHQLFTLALFVLLFILAGCAQSTPPQDVIVQYLEARISTDETALRALSCTAWESRIPLELNSFRGREAVLEDVACTTRESTDDEAVVSCSGQIVVTYNGEQDTFPLGSYRLVNEDGEWKMCGETE